MKTSQELLGPNPKAFEADPIGYSSNAWRKWGLAQEIAGFPTDIEKPPTSLDLKSPILWLTQAHALSEAAVQVLNGEPNLDHLPIYTKGACHCQYHAVALMLVGLSLEICLKAMPIIQEGMEGFAAKETTRRHHRLHKLSSFVPNLSEKDRAILECLTHFIYWAGKYPDPGSGRVDDAESVIDLSEKFEITAKQLFDLSTRIMNYAEEVVIANT